MTAFDDKLNKYPLQAADMIAYSTRQAAELFWPKNHDSKPKPIPPRILDMVLYRNMLETFSGSIAFKGMDAAAMKFFIDLLRDDEKHQKAYWKANKREIKTYYPHEYLDRIKIKVDNIAKIIHGSPPTILQPSIYDR